MWIWLRNCQTLGTCLHVLCTRAFHIEVLEAMDAIAFICALRVSSQSVDQPPVSDVTEARTVRRMSELDNALMEMDQEKIERCSTEQGWVAIHPYRHPPTKDHQLIVVTYCKFVLTTDRYVVQKKVIHTVVAVNLVSKNWICVYVTVPFLEQEF